MGWCRFRGVVKCHAVPEVCWVQRQVARQKYLPVLSMHLAMLRMGMGMADGDEWGAMVGESDVWGRARAVEMEAGKRRSTHISNALAFGDAAKVRTPVRMRKAADCPQP